MHFALLNGMELFCFRRPISLFDGGPKTKHPPPSTAATMTTTTFPRSSTPTTSHLSLFFKKTVVITIGPACHDVDTLCDLLNAGATVARCDLTVRILFIPHGKQSSVRNFVFRRNSSKKNLKLTS